MIKVAACATALLAASAAPLHATDSYIGNWKVNVEKDPFSPKKKTIAMLMDPSRGFLAIRCFPDEGLSVLVLPTGGKKLYEPGQTVHFKYRADEGEIDDDSTEAFGEHAVQMPNARQILTDAEHAGTLNLRIETPDDTSVDLAFKTKGASRALAGLKTDCPAETDKKPDDDKPSDKKASK